MRRILALALLAACSSSPANVAGDYTIAFTNETDGCNFGWTVGQSASGVDVTITQSGANATATVTGGGAGLALGATFGTNVFAGSVDGDSLDLKVIGTAMKKTGNCTYTYNGDITATISGDSLSGRLTYTGAGDGNTDCAGITGCTSYQNFNGTRPPK